MPTNHTENYNLSQWEATDPVLREDFNADNAKIDEALKEQADLLKRKGNCTITARSYDGTGYFGEGYYCELPFPNNTRMIFIFDQETGKFIFWPLYSNIMLSPFYPNSPSTANTGNRRDPNTGNVQWTLRWYSDSAEHQFNIRNRTYMAIALT